jgi:hypothetical protein
LQSKAPALLFFRYRSLIREYRVNGICWIELLIIGNGKYGFYIEATIKSKPW